MRWADVEHWLWPIFSTASCSWRQVNIHSNLAAQHRVHDVAWLAFLSCWCLMENTKACVVGKCRVAQDGGGVLRAAVVLWCRKALVSGCPFPGRISPSLPGCCIC